LAFVVCILLVYSSAFSGVTGLTTEVSPLLTGGGTLRLRMLRAKIFKFFFSKSNEDYGAATKLFANFLIEKGFDEALLVLF
jgi:hypothetical protein